MARNNFDFSSVDSVKPAKLVAEPKRLISHGRALSHVRQSIVPQSHSNTNQLDSTNPYFSKGALKKQYQFSQSIHYLPIHSKQKSTQLPKLVGSKEQYVAERLANYSIHKSESSRKFPSLRASSKQK